jgi:hypothetical protein
MGLPAEVFAELARQAHAPLPTMPEDLWTQRQWPGVTIKADREPFWSVMQKLCRQLGLGLQVPGTREGLTIVTGGGIEFTKSPTVISGPFLIVAQQVTENRTVRFSDPANTSQQMNLQLLVIAEPKLELSGRSSSLNVLAAENEDGQSLVQLSPHSSSVMMDNRHSWGLMAQLARIPDSEKLAVFKGETTAQIAVKKETLEIDDILAAKNVSRPLAGREVVIESAEMSGDQLVVHVIVRGDLHGMAIHNLFRQFRVQDAAGNDWGQSGFRSNGRNGETRGEIRFVSRGGMPPQRRMGGEPAGPPARLVWEAVTETKDITLEFEFRNLPLP